MPELEVMCLVNRSWDIAEKGYTGEEKHGFILHFLTVDHEERHEAAGVVCFDDNTFKAVPLKFITKI